MFPEDKNRQIPINLGRGMQSRYYPAVEYQQETKNEKGEVVTFGHFMTSIDRLDDTKGRDSSYFWSIEDALKMADDLMMLGVEVTHVVEVRRIMAEEQKDDFCWTIHDVIRKVHVMNDYADAGSW